MSASMVNGALESFVKAAAIELPRNIRINCVSPTVITEAMKDYAPILEDMFLLLQHKLQLLTVKA